jgi:MFS family permease
MAPRSSPSGPTCHRRTVAVVPVALAGLAGIGFSWSLFIASTIATLQTAERALLGRVMSWLAVVLIGGTAAGGPLAGTVAALCGPRALFVVGAAAALATASIVRPGTDHQVRRSADWS